MACLVYKIGFQQAGFFTIPLLSLYEYATFVYNYQAGNFTFIPSSPTRISMI